MASNEPPTDTATALRGGIYPTFRLQDEEYSIAILKVKEIIGLMEINPIPKTPGFGVDLKAKFILGMAKCEDGVKILLDIAKVVGEEELAGLAQAA